MIMPAAGLIRPVEAHGDLSMMTIYALVWCQAVAAARPAISCLSYRGQPTFTSREACESYAGPLRLRFAGKASVLTIECMARMVSAGREPARQD